MIKKSIFIIFALSLLSGCFGGRTGPSTFYTLVPINNDIKIKTRGNMVAIVELVSVPGYLDRPEITTIKNTNTELTISEYNRWAEPLPSAIQRVITENMSNYMTKAVVRPLNLFRKRYDYSILIYINRFEGKFNDKVYLDAWYSIVNRNGTNIVNKRVNFNTEVGDNYTDLVEKMSLLLSNLSESISNELSKL